MAVRITETSRLRFAKLAQIGGIETWNLPEYPKIEAAPDDSRYKVDRHDRIDRLAYNFYGNTELWWVIALRNDLRLLPNDLRPNAIIAIPSQRRVFTRILRLPSGGVVGR